MHTLPLKTPFIITTQHWDTSGSDGRAAIIVNNRMLSYWLIHKSTQATITTSIPSSKFNPWNIAMIWHCQILLDYEPKSIFTLSGILSDILEVITKKYWASSQAKHNGRKGTPRPKVYTSWTQMGDIKTQNGGYEKKKKIAQEASDSVWLNFRHVTFL